MTPERRRAPAAHGRPSTHLNPEAAPHRTAEVNLERVVIHAACWGPPEALLDAIDAGAWRPEIFTERREVAEVLAEAVAAADVPPLWCECWAVVAHRRLVAAGVEHGAAWYLVDDLDAFAAAGYRLGGLEHHLAQLAKARAREAATARLRQLAAGLEHRPEDVAAALGVEVAA